MKEIEDRVVTIGEGGPHAFTMYRFLSKEDLEKHLLQALQHDLDEVLHEINPEIPKIAAAKALEKYQDKTGGKAVWEKKIEKYWTKQNTDELKAIHIPDFHFVSENMARGLGYAHESDHKQNLIDAELAASRARKSAASSGGGLASHAPPQAASHWLEWTGLAVGGGFAIHGTIAAIAAVNPNTHKRDWRKTALHTAEALVGAAVGWVAFISLRNHGNQR